MINMQTKKEKSPVLVISTIIALAIFIILTPVFRVAFPKDEPKENTTKTISLLTCTKTSTDSYIITSKVKYTDNIPDRNTIIYSKSSEEIQPQTSPPTTNNVARSAIEEISFFKEITDIKVIEAENTTTVTIKQENIDNSIDNIELANYLLPLDEQQKYYQDQEYTCNITEF